MYLVSEAALDWAMKSVLLRGDTDLFPTPFEYLAIADDWDNIREHLSRQDMHTWRIGAARSCLGFCQNSVLQPK